VTDADLVLGRIPAAVEFPGIGHLDVGRAHAALAGACVTAEDVVRVVDAAMTEAVRVVTVAEGTDPRECALVAFGGAGPLHAVAIADALGMPVVIVPARAGVLSAVGLLTAPEQVDMVASVLGSGSDPTQVASTLTADAVAALPGSTVDVAFDCRYVGQSHEVRVPRPDEFHEAHMRRNGYRRDGRPVEVVAVRATATRPSPVALADLPDAAAVAVTGPAVVAQAGCTVWVPAGWCGEPGAAGALVLRRVEVQR
jgi:N-methylhydantoinase A